MLPEPIHAKHIHAKKVYLINNAKLSFTLFLTLLLFSFISKSAFSDYAIAYGYTPKYARNFAHFDYVNPDAEKVREQACDFFANSKSFGGARKQDKNDGLRGGMSAWGRIRKYLRTAFVLNVVSIRTSLLKRNPTRKAVAALLPNKNIQESIIPLSCNAIDMTNGKVEIFSENNIREAVNAGTAVGIVFPPYLWNGTHYTDAAPISSVPAYASRKLGSDIVLAIDIRTSVPEMPAFHNGFDVISRIEMTSSKIHNDKEVASADFVLTPPVLDILWGDFSDVEKIINIGRESAKAIIPELKKSLE